MPTLLDRRLAANIGKAVALTEHEDGAAIGILREHDSEFALLETADGTLSTRRLSRLIELEEGAFIEAAFAHKRRLYQECGEEAWRAELEDDEREFRAKLAQFGRGPQPVPVRPFRRGEH